MIIPSQIYVFLLQVIPSVLLSASVCAERAIYFSAAVSVKKTFLPAAIKANRPHWRGGDLVFITKWT